MRRAAALVARARAGADRCPARPVCQAQPLPRTHGIQFSPDGRRMYVADLGLDRVYVYRVDAAAATIAPAATPFVAVHAGAGPRHLQMSRDGAFLYVSHETDSQVSVFAARGDMLAEVQTVSTLPPGFAGRNTTAEIILAAGGRTPRNLRIDPTGRFLFSANQDSGTITVFRLDPASGLPTPIPATATIETPGGLYFAGNR